MCLREATICYKCYGGGAARAAARQREAKNRQLHEVDARGLVLLPQAAGASAVADRREELYRCYIATLNLNGRTPDGVRGEWAGVDPLSLGMLLKPRESTLAPRKRRYSSRYS